MAFLNEKELFRIRGETKKHFLIRKINRKEWGLTWSAMLEAGRMLVGDQIPINIGMPLAKQFGAV